MVSLCTLFPPHLVREYLRRFELTPEQRVLDPFCGTGTTLVESKKNGIPSVGVEANPAAYLASKVKVDWSPDPDGLLEHATQIARRAKVQLDADRVPDEAALLEPNGHELRELPPETARLLLKNSISPRPLHKTLVLLDCIEACQNQKYYDHERLALASALTGPNRESPLWARGRSRQAQAGRGRASSLDRRSQGHGQRSTRASGLPGHASGCPSCRCS